MSETETVNEKTEVKANKAKEYLKALPKRYFITAFSGMAQGLFVTLIAGTILAQIAGWIGDNYVGNTLMFIANIAKSLMVWELASVSLFLSVKTNCLFFQQGLRVSSARLRIN